MVSGAGFWRGKRVLLTGHTGFKGGWLALRLQELGAELMGYALPPPTSPSLFAAARVGEGMSSTMGDIRDLGALQSAVAGFAPDVVFHLAAQSLVRPSYEDPVQTYATNVMGTVNLLECARRCDTARVVVVVTSDKCYRNDGVTAAFAEDAPMGGYDPYSSSKGCAELVTAAYRSSYLTQRPALASVRAGNVIGGGDWAVDRLVPDIVSALQAGRAASIRNPDAVRPWQHVLESVSGYLRLAERLWHDGQAYAEAWNLGADPQEAQPVAWIADHLTRLWGRPGQWTAERRTDGKHEAAFLTLDSAKARARLGWRPRLGLLEALEWTVEWYRACAQGADARQKTLEQIARHAALAAA
jgi:CDP-glucose 4,6-dehydratase